MDQAATHTMATAQAATLEHGQQHPIMHMAWERLSLVYAILIPPLVVLVFVAIMVFESDYTHLTRLFFFGPHTETVAAPSAH